MQKRKGVSRGVNMSVLPIFQEHKINNLSGLILLWMHAYLTATAGAWGLMSILRSLACFCFYLLFS